jgi:hypothetical protein
VSAEFTNQAPCIEKRVVKGLKGFVRVCLQGVRCREVAIGVQGRRVSETGLRVHDRFIDSSGGSWI